MPTTIKGGMLRSALSHMGFAGEHVTPASTFTIQSSLNYLTLVSTATLVIRLPLLIPEAAGKNAKVTRFGFIFTCPNPAGTPALTVTVPGLYRSKTSADSVLKATAVAQSAVDLITSAGSVGTGIVSAANDTIYAPTITTPASLTFKTSSPTIGALVDATMTGVLDFREEDFYAIGSSSWHATNNDFNPMDSAVLGCTIANNDSTQCWWGVTAYAVIQRKRK